MKYLGGSIWYLFTLSYLLQLIAKKENHNNTTACHNFCKEVTQCLSRPPHHPNHHQAVIHGRKTSGLR